LPIVVLESNLKEDEGGAYTLGNENMAYEMKDLAIMRE